VADNDLVSATGLALAALAALVERPGPAAKGETAHCLRLLAEAAATPVQGEILRNWAQLLDRDASRTRQ
jgi:hypothetical protein